MSTSPSRSAPRSTRRCKPQSPKSSRGRSRARTRPRGARKAISTGRTTSQRRMQDVPYRPCVPADWDGTSDLPLVMFLHGANNDESSYLDQNNKQMVTLAEQHGYVLVSPLGYNGAYGNFLRLSADFSQPEGATKLLAMRTPEAEKNQELSEKDVINVLELVLNEYPIDRSKMFLTGHSMGSGGTWYIGGKYATYWAALAPMFGAFVLETGYPLENSPQ